MAPYFIFLGAQKSGSSWLYACLFEHPEIYSPIKEIHFFSRERNWSKGYDWYENIFSGAPNGAKSGEFSTSYFFDEDAPKRIHLRYPNAKLIACLRCPAERAYSNYLNSLRSGELLLGTSFEKAIELYPEIINQGHYKKQLERYLELFPQDQLLILIYEDIAKDPNKFLDEVYQYLGINRQFIALNINRRINKARIPSSIWIERCIENTASLLRRVGFNKIVWSIKNLGIPEIIRTLNTSRKNTTFNKIPLDIKNNLLNLYQEDILYIEGLLGKKLHEWRT